MPKLIHFSGDTIEVTDEFYAANYCRVVLYAAMHLISMYGHALAKNKYCTQQEKALVNRTRLAMDNTLKRIESHQVRKGLPNAQLDNYKNMIEEQTGYLNEILDISLAAVDDPGVHENIIKKLTLIVKEENEKFQNAQVA